MTATILSWRIRLGLDRKSVSLAAHPGDQPLVEVHEAIDAISGRPCARSPEDSELKIEKRNPTGNRRDHEKNSERHDHVQLKTDELRKDSLLRDGNNLPLKLPERIWKQTCILGLRYSAPAKMDKEQPARRKLVGHTVGRIDQASKTDIG